MISICIIAKNEEKNIGRCLESFSNLKLELIVVDTGSTDRTCDIASKYTDKLYHYEWCDDFSKAKNFAVSKASNRWVCVIDADEYLEEKSRKTISEIDGTLLNKSDMIGRIKRINLLEEGKNSEWINRIFDREKFSYEGRIHEQLRNISGEDYKSFKTDITIIHTGYLLPMEERIKKANRNIRLLGEELKLISADRETNKDRETDEGTKDRETDEGGKDRETDKDRECRKEEESKEAYLLYQLGKSYYFIKDYDKACEAFAAGLSFDLNPKLEYVIDMVETNGYAMINSGRAADALSYENIYEEFGYNADFDFLMGLIYMNNELYDKAVEYFLRAGKYADCRMEGVNSYLAFYNAAVVCDVLGRKDEAINYYEHCASYDKAMNRLEEIRKDI